MSASYPRERFAQRAKEIEPQVIAWRHAIHSDPELAFREVHTSALIEEQLKRFGLDEVRRVGSSGTGVLGVLHGTGAGPRLCLALRADIDALPIPEESGVPFASRNPEVFHGCGHDTHASCLLGAAWLLAEFRDAFAGTVKFCFQHAEEVLGGAQEFVDAGVLDDVDAVLALHALPDIELGQVGVRYDAMTAGVDAVKITVEGKRAHGAYPHFGVDTILIASTIVTQLMTLGSRELWPTDCALVTFGTIHGGISNSYIGAPVVLEGSLRTLRDDTRELFVRRIREIAESTAAGLRGKATVEFRQQSWPTTVDRRWVDRVRDACAQVEGASCVDLRSPAMGSEDFALFLRKAPGALFRLGCRTPGGPHCPTHSPQFYADDRCLRIGCEVMAATALNALAEAQC